MTVDDNKEKGEGRGLLIVGSRNFKWEGSLQDGERRMTIDIGYRHLRLLNK